MDHQLSDMSKCLEMGHVCACLNLRKAARAVTQLYDGLLRPSGLRSTQLSLLAAVRVLGPVTVKHLAEAIVMDPTTLTRNLQPLEKQGLIRVELGDDRRERIVTATNRGLKALANAVLLWEKAQARVAKGLGEERFRQLLSDLSAILGVAKKS